MRSVVRPGLDLQLQLHLLIVTGQWEVQRRGGPGPEKTQKSRQPLMETNWTDTRVLPGGLCQCNAMRRSSLQTPKHTLSFQLKRIVHDIRRNDI